MTSTIRVGDAAEVVALVLGRDARARLREALRRRADVVFVLTCQELCETVAARRAAAVIVELRDAEGVLTASAIRRLREGFPLVPVIVYCAPTTSASIDLLAAVRAGPSGLIMGGIDDVGVRLEAAIASAEDDCVARRAWLEVERHVRGPGRPILEYFLVNAREAPSVEGAARAFGMHRKTLRSRLARDGLPPPQAVIGWCRLLLAARLLEDRGRHVEQVALLLNFPSAASLRNMLLRYTGLKPRDVRQAGGFARVLAAFVSELRSRECSFTAPAVAASDVAQASHLA